MDLIAATPTLETALFEFKDSDNGAVITTNKGNIMFVEIYGSHTKEFNKAKYASAQEMSSLMLEYKLNKLEDMTEENEKYQKFEESFIDISYKFLSEITVDLLIQVDGKETKNKDDFYKNKLFSVWIDKVNEFAGKTANFIRA